MNVIFQFLRKKPLQLLLAVLSMLFYSNSNAQGLNTEIGLNQSYHHWTNGIASTNDAIYYANTYKYDLVTFNPFITSATISKTDTLGTILWTKNLEPAYEYAGIQQIIASHDGGVYVAGYAREGCDFINTQHLYVRKISSDGLVVWEYLIEDRFGFISALTEYAPGKVMFQKNDGPDLGSITTYTFVQLNENGQETGDELSTALYNAKGMALQSGFDYVAYKGHELYGFLNDSIAADTLPFTAEITGLTSLNDTLILLTQDSIFRLDGQFQLLSGTTINGYTNYSGLKIIDGEIRFLSRQTPNHFLLALDESLQLSSVLTIPTGTIEPEYTDFSRTHLSIADNVNLPMFQTIRITDHSLESADAATINSTDVTITNIVINETSLAPVNGPVGSPSAGTLNFDVSVLLKNEGPNHLTSCRMNHWLSPGICSDFLYSVDFPNLNIAPGDSAWIDLGWVGGVTNFYSDSEPFNFNFCVYTSHPNHLTDINISNDELCKSVLINHVGLEEQQTVQLTLFPNPVRDMLLIETPAQTPLHYSIVNAQGQTVLSGITDNKQIVVNQLSSGMYTIRLSSEDLGTITRKLAIE